MKNEKVIVKTKNEKVVVKTKNEKVVVKTKNEKAIVNTKNGQIAGTVFGDYVWFKGIPYAKAQRFCPPEPVSWEGLRECSVFGKKAMQVFDNGAPWGKPQTREEFDEDCLNLNIYVPEGSFGGLPVLIEVHGGAFQGGSNQEHTPEQMIRDNHFIYVSLNYRLGVFGFLYIPESEENSVKVCHAESDFGRFLGNGNLGLMDIMAAVRWIYENISAFGGDPERITLMGSSAGAKAIGALMCTPDLEGYVHQLILSSGGTQSIRDRRTAKNIYEKFMEIVRDITGNEGLDREDLKLLPADTLIAAQKILCDNPGNTCMFGPVADGLFLPEDWERIAMSGTLWHGRAMIGSSLHELAFYKMMQPDFSQNAPQIAQCLFGENAKIAMDDFICCSRKFEERCGYAPSEEARADIWVRILTDYMYRTYSYRLAARLAAKKCRIWQYCVSFLPALHCFDQQLAFEKPLPVFFSGQEHINQAKLLGSEIYKAFVHFIENGHPMAVQGNDGAMDSDDSEMWPCLSLENPVQMVWNEESCLCPVRADEVLSHIGEAVYQLS